MIDPIEELAQLALKHSLPLHVDACFGGFMLPWVEKIGYKVPLWDFRVEGVTSISADIHKYGYSSKGASVISYSSEEYRSYQYFAYAEWPGGLFGSPSLTGKYYVYIPCIVDRITLSLYPTYSYILIYTLFYIYSYIHSCTFICRFSPRWYDRLCLDHHECHRTGRVQGPSH